MKIPLSAPTTFQDYSERAIFSYRARLALSLLQKSSYQQAGVTLGLPDRSPVHLKGAALFGSPSVLLVKGLLSGLEINWRGTRGAPLTSEPDTRAGFFQAGAVPAFSPCPSGRSAQSRRRMVSLPPQVLRAARFSSIYSRPVLGLHHMPQGQPIAHNPPDFDTLIDFHQALSSLNSYPELLRALGLVFDFDLPARFLSIPHLAFNSLAVVDIEASWAIPTQSPPEYPLETAYLYFSVGGVNPVYHCAGLLGRLDRPGSLWLAELGPSPLWPCSGRSGGRDVQDSFLAETWQDRRRLEPPDHPQIFDDHHSPGVALGWLFVICRWARPAHCILSRKRTKFNNDLQ